MIGTIDRFLAHLYFKQHRSKRSLLYAKSYSLIASQQAKRQPAFKQTPVKKFTI